jgi:hypothetical protein
MAIRHDSGHFDGTIYRNMWVVWDSAVLNSPSIRCRAWRCAMPIFPVEGDRYAGCSRKTQVELPVGGTVLVAR